MVILLLLLPVLLAVATGYAIYAHEVRAAGVTALCGVYFLVDGLRGGEHPLLHVIQGIFYLYWAAWMLQRGLSRLEIRERGLLYFDSLLRWDQIVSYRWEGAEGRTLTIVARRRLPLGRTVSYAVDRDDKERVNRVLAHRVSGVNQA